MDWNRQKKKKMLKKGLKNNTVKSGKSHMITFHPHLVQRYIK